MEAVHQEAVKSDDGYGIKKIFQDWDQNQDGSITRQELARVLKEISPLTERDIDKLMEECDTNANGLIEYEEFVDWVMKPPAKSQVRAMLDYKRVLRPLFDVYDRNRNGSISFQEFEECHGILQSVLLRAKEDSDGPSQNDPLDLQKDAKQAFLEADTTGDGEVTFRDFVQWMRQHLVSLPDFADIEGDLEQIMRTLARMLTQVFSLQQLAEVRPLHANWAPTADEQETSKVLDRLLDNLGRTARKLEEVLGKDVDEETITNRSNGWTEPPPGMNVERLKGTHMRLHPLKPGSVEEVEFEVMVIPSPEAEGLDGPADPAGRRWLAEVVRKVKYRDGHKASTKKEKRGVHVDRPSHYAYQPDDLRWVLQDGPREFEEALGLLPSELQVFCLLKTEANFGVKISWRGARAALRSAANMDLMDRDEVAAFEESVQDEVRRIIAEQGLQGCISPCYTRASESAMLTKILERKLDLSPQHVMAKLSELGIVKLSPVWKDFMNSEDHCARLPVKGVDSI